mgnify:CR=1 FL=1
MLLGLANLCEYWERGLDDSLARMEGLRATLDQVGRGGWVLVNCGCVRCLPLYLQFVVG